MEGVEIDQETGLPVLEEICERCQGEGEWTEYGQDVRCCDCGGSGHIPTAAGEAILDLIRHNLEIVHGKTRWRD